MTLAEWLNTQDLRELAHDYRISLGTLYSIRSGGLSGSTVASRLPLPPEVERPIRKRTFSPVRARIRALLGKRCLGFAEIGNRVGFSRERIRQIAAEEGFETGRIRHKICVVSKPEPIPDWAAELTRRSGIQAVPLQGKSSQRRALMNGRVVTVQTGSIHRGTSYMIRPSKRRDYEFAIWMFPDGHCLVIPAMFVPAKQTTFRIKLKDFFHPGGFRTQLAVAKALPPAFRHDYRYYIDHWELLK